MEFKICGLKSLEHALAAADAGASLLGFVFVPGVRRQVSVEQARDVICHTRELRGANCPRIVGLFANQPLREVNKIVKQCDLDFAQLCGDEPPDYWDNVDAWVMRQVKVDDSLPGKTAVSTALGEIEEVVNRLHLTLLDKRLKGALGGTGHTFDWGIASEIARRHPVFLAGGLAPGQRATGNRHSASMGRGCLDRRGNGRRQGYHQDRRLCEDGARCRLW